MKFNIGDDRDEAVGFAYATCTSAIHLIEQIGSDYYEVEFEKTPSDLYGFDGEHIYKVTISVERA